MQGDFLDFEKDIEDLERLIADLKSPERRAQARAEGIDLDEKIAPLDAEIERILKQRYRDLSPWEKTQIARHRARPYSLDYVRLIFDEFVELSGDRVGTNDEAIVGGPARLEGHPVMVIGQQKGRDIRERQRRNFGMARGAGYRKALRLAQMAEKFGLPLISFVDTAGAAADLEAEEQGVSESIAHNLRDFSILATPSVCVVIGEGGSGGALGMSVADRVLMLENSVYSVISPEGCASILWYDKTRAADAAQALKLTAENAVRFGIVDEILPEPLGGAHRDPLAMAATVKEALLRHLGELRAETVETLVDRRYARLRQIGVFHEAWAEAEDEVDIEAETE